MGYQLIIIQGNLTRDAEVRQVGQSQVAKTAVAVSEKFRKADGTQNESTEFFDIEIWDKQGIIPFLVKGQQVLVEGQQKTDRWTDQSGNSKEAKKIRVRNIQLCGNKTQPQATAQPTQPYPPQYNAPAPGANTASAPVRKQYQAPTPAPTPAPAPAFPPQYHAPVEQPDLPF